VVTTVCNDVECSPDADKHTETVVMVKDECADKHTGAVVLVNKEHSG